MMLNGNVTANDMVKYRLGLASGIAERKTAGTTM
jgi:hypothetical protein